MKVLVYPKATNPYQELLSRHLGTKELTVTNLAGPKNLKEKIFQVFIISFLLTKNRIKGYRILHIHWLYPLDFPGRSISPFLSKLASTVQTNLFFLVIKLLRYRLIWTVHDLLPHDAHTLNDIKTTQRLFNISNCLIMLSNSTLEEAKKLNIKFDQRKISIVPHGNYIEHYPNNVSTKIARKKLDISPGSFVFLFFGRMEIYKNVPALIKSFLQITKDQPDATLLIAGKGSSSIHELEIKKLATSDSIRLNIAHIPDDQVQLYYMACNIVVCPFSEITNSGSIILAASFGKPVIAPLIGSIQDLPRSMGIFYDPSAANALTESMKKAIAETWLNKTMALSSIEYARELSWDRIASLTRDVYEIAGRK